MNSTTKGANPNLLARRLTRWLFVGAAVIAIVAAAGLGLLEHYRARLRESLPRTDNSIALPGTSSNPIQGAFGFAFLNQPHAIPVLRFVDDAGKPRTLADFRGRGIVLNIWATWCVPCRKEMPTLDQLQVMVGGADVLVMPLSIDRQGPSVVKNFYNEIGAKSLGIYIDESGTTSDLLGLVGIPTTLLIDADGQEVARKIGPLGWDEPEVVALIRSHLKGVR